MTVSIIIVNYNGLEFTRQCLETLYRYHDSKMIEVIVVDNNSTDGSQKDLPVLFPSITLISLPENKGFGAANNAGAAIAKGEFLFFVNNDTLFREEILSVMKTQILLNEKCGIVGPKLLNQDQSFQLSFGSFPSLRTEMEAKQSAHNYSLQSAQDIVSHLTIKKDWVTGAAFMIKRHLFELVGGFDEHYFMYFEDIDLCKTVCEKGYHVLYVPQISLIHLGGKSYPKRDDKIVYEYRRSQLRYYDKHNSLFQRIAVRKYIGFKFFPKIFTKKGSGLAKKVLKLLFSSQH